MQKCSENVIIILCSARSNPDQSIHNTAGAEAQKYSEKCTRCLTVILWSARSNPSIKQQGLKLQDFMIDGWSLILVNRFCLIHSQRLPYTNYYYVWNTLKFSPSTEVLQLVELVAVVIIEIFCNDSTNMFHQ